MNTSTSHNNHEPASFTKEERDQLLATYIRITDQLQAASSLPAAQRSLLIKARKQPKREYFERIPRLPLSRCPFSGELLIRAFDPWGLDGFWWQDDERSVAYDEPIAPASFQVLTGALGLNGLPPVGGLSPVLAGPEVPFVIPRILELPTMVAVISSVPLANGYTAYPIVYYAESAPPAGSLTQTWLQAQYNFQTEDGRWGWDVRNDPWDFDLIPWVERGKIKWIAPGDATFTIREGAESAFPYEAMEGRRERQIITGDTLRTEPPPNHETIAPF